MNDTQINFSYVTTTERIPGDFHKYKQVCSQIVDQLITDESTKIYITNWLTKLVGKLVTRLLSYQLT